MKEIEFKHSLNSETIEPVFELVELSGECFGGKYFATGPRDKRIVDTYYEIGESKSLRVRETYHLDDGYGLVEVTAKGPREADEYGEKIREEITLHADDALDAQKFLSMLNCRKSSVVTKIRRTNLFFVYGLGKYITVDLDLVDDKYFVEFEFDNMSVMDDVKWLIEKMGINLEK